MDKLRNFLKKKKVDKHFKHSGSGQRLDSGTSKAPSVVSGSSQGGGIDRVAASDVAAQAAYKRLQKDTQPQISASQKKIQMLAQRELEAERRKNDPAYAMQQLNLEPTRTTDVQEFEHSSAIYGVLFTCELLDDVSQPKHELMATLEEFLRNQILVNDSEPEDAVIAAVLMIFSLNAKPQREEAVQILSKYIQNIIEHPGEAKYQRIRIANKAFQERVKCVKGGNEFLEAVGFRPQMQSMNPGDNPEEFLVISDEQSENTALLITALETLRDGHSVPIKVSRNLSVIHLKENQPLPNAKVSSDFFDLTAEELKNEQQSRTDEVNMILKLRTREMRERDAQLRSYKYKYTAIRIRMPDNYVVEGTFGCFEPFSAVRSFVQPLLSENYQALEWNLKDPLDPDKNLDEESSLAVLKLAPAAILHLVSSPIVRGDSLSDGTKSLAHPLEIS